MNALLVLSVVVSLFWTTVGFTVKRTGDNSNWCCEVEPTISSSNFTSIEIHQFTKVIWEEKEGPVHQCEPGEDTTVGLFSWDCQSMVNVSRTVTTYQQVPVVKPVIQQGVCPTEHLVCCEGYVKHQDQCLKSSAINSLQALIDAGLIG
ncbi:uncharacterized protein LOC110449086 [Mizuhopecten yessoensis]|uniref:Uncharacterized protein n=1 Tax=Mizuhopecten yessoensis TaxID=6573 RepID=A0A210R5W9_MIZYE|nr:uncharacterized protein LOC110449086 [Mizuhopecten yessoensis]OWF56326.1 hypothetical protein KP79_PYT08282 [Mizuhopecten yessoensis]